jgi:membrane protein required for colicin V production
LKAIDFILIIPILFGIYDGYKKGFLLVIISLLSFILGIVGAFKLIQVGIDYLIIYFPHMPKLVPFMSFTLIFFAISLGIYLLGLLIKKGLNFTVFAGQLDNVMGAMFGLCQWVFMLSILIWLIKQANFAIPLSVTKGSLVFSYLDTLAPTVVEKLHSILPFADHLFDSIKHIFKEL